MTSLTLRRGFFIAAVVATACLLSLGQGQAAPKTYKYRCPKCKLIQEYGTMGVTNCPNDDSTMIRMN